VLARVKRLFSPELEIVEVEEYSYLNPVSPLAYAAQQGCVEIVEYLLTNQTLAQSGADEMLEAAVEAGLLAQVQRILAEHGDGIDLEAEMPYGYFQNGAPRYFLMLACALGRLEIVRVLLHHGASVHVGMDGTWSVPLIFMAAGMGDGYTGEASGEERVALIKVLIMKGALYSAAQWAAFAVGRAHLEGLDVKRHLYRLDASELVRAAVSELGLVWGQVGEV
jgi:hypothetical protein